MDYRSTRFALIFLVAMLLPFVPGCDESNRLTAGLDAKFRASLALLDAGGNPAAEFTAGEPVTFSLTITNRTADTQKIVFPDSQTYDFELRDGAGQQVWNWAHGQNFLTKLTPVDFAPLETKTFSHTWDQTGNDGHQVPGGDYDALGFLPADVDGVRSAPVAVKILP